MNANDQSDTIVNGAAGANTAAGQLRITSASHNQLWFEQSGENLVIDVLGTAKQAVIQNWYANAGSQLQDIVADDGSTLDASLQSLVQAMASFSEANPAFNPATTTNANLTGGSYAGALAATAASAWHG
jgi:hypothetical protein